MPFTLAPKFHLLIYAKQLIYLLENALWGGRANRSPTAALELWSCRHLSTDDAFIAESWWLAVHYRKGMNISSFSSRYVKQAVGTPGRARKTRDIVKHKGLQDTEKPGRLTRLHLGFLITFSMSAWHFFKIFSCILKVLFMFCWTAFLTLYREYTAWVCCCWFCLAVFFNNVFKIYYIVYIIYLKHTIIC